MNKHNFSQHDEKGKKKLYVAINSCGFNYNFYEKSILYFFRQLMILK